MRRAERNSTLRSGGFTLLEMVVTIAILGILGAAVAVFLQKPVQGYFDTARRVQLVNTADFALRRIARDLAMAIPNSARSDAGPSFLEMLLARSGGRFCNAADCYCAGCGSPFSSTEFAVLGPTVEVANNDAVIIGNLPNSGCDAYAAAAPNRRALTFVASPTASIRFSGGGFSASCGQTTQRFQIARGPVSYACDAGTGTLWRYSSYAIQAAQPASIAALEGLAGVVKAALATNVNCGGTSLDAAAKGEGLVELRIQLQDASGESVSLYRQVKVDNTP